MKKFLAIAAILTLLPQIAFAAFTGDLSISPGQVRLSGPAVEGKPIKIYASVNNTSKRELLGSVRFYNATSGKLIGTSQVISILPGRTDDVFVDFIPDGGEQRIQVTVLPSEPEINNPSNDIVMKPFYFEPDSDRDGKINKIDPDDDNDGVQDTDDAFPLNYHETKDSDLDGIGDHKDLDDDQDGVLDTDETLDTDGDGVLDVIDTDDDQDGIPDVSDGIPKNLKPEISLSGPTVLAGFGQATFDASQSKDPDGEVLVFAWSIDGKSIPTPETQKSLSHTFNTPGKHFVTLKVTDGKGESSTRTERIYLVGAGTALSLILFVIFLIIAIAVIIRYSNPAYEGKHSSKISRTRRRTVRMRK